MRFEVSVATCVAIISSAVVIAAAQPAAAQPAAAQPAAAGEEKKNVEWDISFSIPAIRLRQGEPAQLFQGIAVGIPIQKNFKSGEGAWLFTPAFMLSMTNTISQDGNNKSSEYVLAPAFLVGVRKDKQSFQIGYSYDVLSSESSDVLRNRKRGAFLFTIGTGF